MSNPTILALEGPVAKVVWFAVMVIEASVTPVGDRVTVGKARAAREAMGIWNAGLTEGHKG